METIFNSYGWQVISCEPLVQGLINKTYIVKAKDGEFILQTINHHIFKSPKSIDHNINHLGKWLNTHEPDYVFTHLVPNKEGSTLLTMNGEYFRAFKKIDGYALSVLKNDDQVFEAAQQFGNFTSVLNNFPIQNLQITLPDFHNLSLRFAQFSEALIKGNNARIENCKEAISFLLSHQHYVSTYENFIAHSDVKKRVTHHDTKISNVLFNNKESGSKAENAICVIDLDTTMPGYFISDMGDMCRTCLCTVSEEEANLELVKVIPSRWEALQKGYLQAMNRHLSTFEKEHIFFAGQYMIYMQALRFLTDYLNNDSYYGAKYEGQNLVRAFNQIRLLSVYNELG
jgi:Ser/Thr protein kinase RdoA (MazF antagonist)